MKEQGKTPKQRVDSAKIIVWTFILCWAGYIGYVIVDFILKHLPL